MTEPTRTSEHAAAVAHALLLADGAAEARMVTATCDLGNAVGEADGFHDGTYSSDAVVSTHCLANITPSVLASFAAEVGNDAARLEERAKRACGVSMSPRPASRYGEALLGVARGCAGDHLCGMQLQAAFQQCYLVGWKVAIRFETEKALERMLRTCGTFHADGSACRDGALSHMSDLRRLAAGPEPRAR